MQQKSNANFWVFPDLSQNYCFEYYTDFQDPELESENVTFLIHVCFPMNYRDFSVKINGENISEIMIFIFTVCKKKRSVYEFSAKSLAQKVLKCNILAWNFG